MIGPQTSDIRIPSFAHYAQQDAYALSMVRRLHVDLRLATQVLVLQVAVVTLTLGIAGGLIAFMSHERLAAQYEDRSEDAINKDYQCDVPVLGDAKLVLRQLLAALHTQAGTPRAVDTALQEEIRTTKAAWLREWMPQTHCHGDADQSVPGSVGTSCTRSTWTASS